MQLIDKELQTSREDFVKHFRANYSDRYPPAWMLVEILPFGVLTRIYENLASNRIRKHIAQHFALNIPVFTSWLTIVTLTRNTCCHHARMWNRTLSLRALTMNRSTRPWIQQFISLLSAFPMVDIAAMGFPPDWENEPLWRQ